MCPKSLRLGGWGLCQEAGLAGSSVHKKQESAATCAHKEVLLSMDALRHNTNSASQT